MFFFFPFCPYHTFKGLNKVEGNRKEKKTSFPENTKKKNPAVSISPF